MRFTISRSLMAFALWVMVLTGLTACSKSNDSKSSEFVYPLAVGNQWEYLVHWKTVYRDSIDYDTISTLTVNVSGVDTISESRLAYTFHAMNVEPDSSVWESITVYENAEDGLYRLAGQNIGPTGTSRGLPKGVVRGLDSDRRNSVMRSAAAYVGPLGAALSGDAADSLTWYETPYKSLQYPLQGTWRYRDSEIGYIDKTVTGKETVKMGSIPFSCHKIEWLYEDMTGAETTEFVSAQGLVKREFIVHYLHYSSGDTVTLHEFVELQQVTLP